MAVDLSQLPLDFTGEEWAALMERYYPLVMRQAYTDASETLGLSLSFDVENERVQEVLGELAERVTSIADTTKQQIQALVGRQAAEAWSLEELAAQIEQLGEIAGVERAKVIAATETADAYTRASLLAYQDSGVVEGKEWLVLDPCPMCDPLANKVVALAENFDNGQGWAGPGPPAHPNCRCAVSPVVSKG